MLPGPECHRLHDPQRRVHEYDRPPFTITSNRTTLTAGWRRAKLCDQRNRNSWKPEICALRQPDLMCPTKEWPVLCPVRTLWSILVSGASGAAVGVVAQHPQPALRDFGRHR